METIWIDTPILLETDQDDPSPIAHTWHRLDVHHPVNDLKNEDFQRVLGVMSMMFLANCLKVKKEAEIEELRFGLDDLLTFFNQRLT